MWNLIVSWALYVACRDEEHQERDKVDPIEKHWESNEEH